MAASLRQPALPWQEAALARRLGRGLPQALMVVGRRGDGLLQLCLRLAAETIAGDGGSNVALLEAGEHPDLHLVELEQATTGKLRSAILIGQIRDALEQCALTPMCASSRICVIVPACRMNTNAANSLLKALEEPHRGLRFILGCENPGLLPATIRSRCQRMPAPQPSAKQAAAWLGEQGVKQPAAALALASGAPLAAQANVELAASRELLAQHCTASKPLVGASKLDRLEAGIWLAWAIDWASEGARQACGIAASSEDSGAIAGRINARCKADALAWLDLYAELNEYLALALHPLNNRMLLERVCWRFSTLGEHAD